jgi:(p)ppGpp synthase/HD superfamily hydrolase
VNGHALRELAKAWATVAHDGVSRKGAGEPYMNHCERVADSVWGWRRKTIAYLHDVIEDASQPAAMRTALYTVFPASIVLDIEYLSRLPHWDVAEDSPLYGQKTPYQEWIENVVAKGNQDVIAVKLADLKDNLSDLSDIPGAQSLEKRYLRAQATLLEVFNG